jgi:transporter family-2 protein
MSWAVYLLTIISGLLNPVQSGLTGALEKALERPFTVAAISLSLSLVCALAGAVYQGEFTALGSSVGKAPWWAWLAGFSGFVVLIARPIAAPALGATTFTGITITAGVLGSLVLDQFGWIGFEQHTATLGRIAGAVLMVGGVVMVSLL